MAFSVLDINLVLVVSSIVKPFRINYDYVTFLLFSYYNNYFTLAAHSAVSLV